MMKLMNGKKGASMSPMDAKGSVLDELLSHMDGLDGEDLKSAMNPQDPAAEAGSSGSEPMEGMEGANEPDGDEAAGVAVIADGGGAAAKMSPEEMEELIEAIRSKLGDANC
jgi:hypothetical protein